MPLPRRAAPAAALLTLALAACAPSAPPTGSVAGEPADADPAGDRLVLDNCGTPVEIDHAPRRVVAVKSSVLELLLALGVEDRVVGAAFLDGPVPEEYADAAATVPVVADAAPGREAVLALEPDIVLAGWESTFSAEAAGDRQGLHDLGVLTYVAPAACRDAAHMPRPLTFPTVFAHVREMGDLLGVPDRAAELVARQQSELDALVPDDRGLTALWYSSGVDVPYVGAGLGAPQMIMDAIGLTNVAGDVQDTWTSFGWEEVVEADPDVLVLVDATWNSAEQKIATLEQDPATALLTAVRERRYLVVPFPATEAGVRNVGAATSLSEQLAQVVTP